MPRVAVLGGLAEACTRWRPSPWPATDQGIALRCSAVTVSGNDFAENPVHVADLVGTYDLEAIVAFNS